MGFVIIASLPNFQILDILPTNEIQQNSKDFIVSFSHFIDLLIKN